MRCKKLIRILPKYVDGELPDKRSALVREHIRNCPDCAAEAKALEKMRSLLRTAGAVEAPEAYWETYWDRLEKKLPDEPLPFRIRSRMWTAIAATFRQPAAVGRVAAYVILLALLVYMVAPDQIFKEAPKSGTLARLSAESAREKAFNEELKAGLSDDKSEDVVSVEVRPPAEAEVGESVRRGVPPEGLIEHSVVRDEILSDSEVPKTELESLEIGKELAPAMAGPAKPAIAVEEPAADSLRGVRSDLADEDAAKSKDEYVAAENYFRQGQYLQAIPAYQNFITANVQDERTFRAQYQIAESYYQAGNYSDALSNFVALTNLADSEKKQEAEAQAAAQTPGADGFFYKKPEETKAVAASKPQVEAQNGAAVEESGAKVKRARAAGAEASYGALKQEVAEVAKDNIPETREDLISRAIFRQAQSYENLGNVQEALNKYNEYLAGYPKGVYITQAKEKVEQIGKQQKEKADKAKTDDKGNTKDDEKK